MQLFSFLGKKNNIDMRQFFRFVEGSIRAFLSHRMITLLSPGSIGIEETRISMSPIWKTKSFVFEEVILEDEGKEYISPEIFKDLLRNDFSKKLFDFEHYQNQWRCKHCRTIRIITIRHRIWHGETKVSASSDIIERSIVSCKGGCDKLNDIETQNGAPISLHKIRWEDKGRVVGELKAWAKVIT